MLDPTENRPARLPPGHPPVLAVVVDTEEEFDWSRPFSRGATATATIGAQRLAHARVFERLSIVPTYVVDWPVATTASAIAPLKALMDEGRCEIGTHLHPWVSPPHVEDVNTHNSYTGNLPAQLEFDKLERLTLAIEENFGRRPTMFKAGRYGLGPHTAAALVRLGYQIDASIVPHTSFRADSGPDFTGFDNQPFWFGPRAAPLLELPVTAAFCGWLAGLGPRLHSALSAPMARALRLGGIAARSRALERIRLTPEGCDAAEMIRLARSLVRAGQQVFTLTYHSPSLAPGHTPYVRSAAELERFLGDLVTVCNFFRDELGSVFMSCSTIRDAMIDYRNDTSGNAPSDRD